MTGNNTLPKGVLRCLQEQIPELADLRIRIRHSTAHVMAHVVTRMFPETKLAIGPPTNDGFYYDFLSPESISAEDLEEIELRMKEVIAKDLSFEYAEYSRGECHRDEPRRTPEA